MLHEYQVWNKLTKKEQEWIISNCWDSSSLEAALRASIDAYYSGQKSVSNKNRIDVVLNLVKLLENPPFSLEDSPEWITNMEKELLGVPITCSKIDACNTAASNTTCKEFLDGKVGNVILAVEIVDAREYVIKNGKSKGKKMAFITMEDNTARLDCGVMFSDKWEEFGSIIYPGNTVLVSGKKSEKNSLDIQNVVQL